MGQKKNKVRRRAPTLAGTNALGAEFTGPADSLNQRGCFAGSVFIVICHGIICQCRLPAFAVATGYSETGSPVVRHGRRVRRLFGLRGAGVNTGVPDAQELDSGSDPLSLPRKLYSILVRILPRMAP